MRLANLLCRLNLHARYELGRVGILVALRCHRCAWAATGWETS